MALADILQKIESDASQERDRILNEAQQKVQDIQEDATKKLEQFETQAKIDRERRATKAGERIVSNARHKAKFIRESFKNSIINSVFDEVEKKLAGLSDDAYSTFVKNALESIGSDASKAHYEVAEERSDVTQKLLTSAGVANGNIKVREKGTLRGGFIASTDTQEFDFSFASLLRRIREENEIRVSKELF